MDVLLEDLRNVSTFILLRYHEIAKTLFEVAACGDLLESPVHYPDYMGCLSSNELQVIFCSMLMQGGLG